MMLLQATIAGYQGRPATVIAALDEQRQKLHIERADKMVQSRFKDDSTGLITNQPLDDYDYLLSETDFNQAFSAYRFYQYSGRLTYGALAQRAVPPLQIEKFTENGANLMISGDITNEQIAVIALCFFAQKVTQAQDALSAFEDYQNDSEDDWTELVTI